MTMALEMKNLPANSGWSEYQGAFIHGAPYKVYTDGLDILVYEIAKDGASLKHLCQMSGAEQAERLAIALLRAATILRDAKL